MIDWTATLLAFLAASIATNFALAVLAILAWRWRAPGFDPARLSRLERRLLRMLGDGWH